MDLMYLLELAVNGGMAGLMYSLVAMGIVLIYKSSSVPNLAQGALTMLGAYIVLAFANGAGLPMWLAIPAAMATMFLAGMGIERVALRRLAGRPIVMILMMTLGIDIFIRATTMTIWGGSGRPMQIGISDAPLFLGPLLLNRAYVVGAGVSLLLFVAFMLFFRTRRGVVLRAIADDYMASWAVGISVERGVAFSWALSSLVAMGIVLIYKSSSVPNLAQGALTMVGAYVVLAFADGAGLPMWAAIPLAMLTMMGVGMGIERVALRRLAGRPIVMILMMTLGLDIFLRAITLVIGGGTARPLDIGISNDPLFVGPLLLNRAYVVGAVVALALFAVFVFFFRTRRGVVLRAIADDYMASWSVGISVERGVALSWALSSLVATAAGVLWGSIQGVDQSLSLLLLKGITVAVLGGMDSLGGAILAGIALGVIEAVASGVLDPLLGGGTRELVVALVLILTIMIRPHGLFGRHDIERL